MAAKADQARVKDLITDTITLLCKNALNFRSELSIQALIGVTLDKTDVFLVNINETIFVSDDGKMTTEKPQENDLGSLDACDSVCKIRRNSHLSSKFAQNTNNFEDPINSNVYSSVVEPDDAWLNNANENGLEFTSKSDMNDAKMTVNLPSSSSSSSSPLMQSRHLKKSKQQSGAASLPTSSLSANAVQVKRWNSSGLNMNSSINADLDLIRNEKTDVSNVPESNMKSFTDHHIEIKQELENIDDDYCNEDAFLSSFNGNACSHMAQSSLNSKQILVGSSSAVDYRSGQHEMINGASIILQSKVGGTIRPGPKGLLSHRKRSLNGPTYRMPRNHICNVCGKAFEKKRDLRGHQAAKHQMQKEHKCEICGKEFSYKRSLTDHMFVIHTRANVTFSGSKDDF